MHARDPKDLDVKVKVGWVKGLNRLYFLYEAYDNYWDFSRPDLHNDIFEVVVDGDASGGPLIDMYHRDVWTQQAVGDMSALDPRITSSDAYYAQQGAQAQNYHIFTPAEGQGLDDGLGLRAVHQGPALRQPRAELQLQAPARAATTFWSFTSRRSTTRDARGRSARSRAC
jgi:hypothetical protein